MSDTEKKIIIDEDWKSQVQTEKERAKQPGAEATELQEPATSSAASSGKQQATPPVPEATFEFLINTMTSQALYFMGLIPNPMTNEPTVDLPQAKHFIDMIEILQKKTHGNCTGHEAEQLKHALTQLRLIYLESVKKEGA